ncbi:type II restriction endonuclease subunit M [Hoyosella rhizosphaerae]|uniref:Type II restriction endonuclease subunit M n=1 Tax=Hoyosella rhizosphaerae TaxID=1755582 RepID=A0A916UHY7_9ACTN|nr:type II restriction endonuclease subunit M [Hoyosella rhizosphaerae]
MVTPSEIAEIAGVSRGAVTNWRKRPVSPPFPQPASGTQGKLLYDKADIIEWLDARKHGDQSASTPDSLWTALNKLPTALPATAYGELALALCCAHSLRSGEQAHADDPFGQLRELASAATDRDPAWTIVAEILSEHHAFLGENDNGKAVIAALDTIPDTQLSDAVDTVLHRMAGPLGRIAGYGMNEHGVTGSRIATLLAALASDARGTIYDPACGIGETLTAIAKTRTTDPQLGDVRIIGHDINEDAIRIARMRALLVDVPATFNATDVLKEDPDPELRADTIVCEPPFGVPWEPAISDQRWAYGVPSPKNADLAWIQHALAHLTPSGRAYIITPPSTLYSVVHAPIRSALVKRGCVESIILLPPKMHLHTSIPLAVWVLRQPTNPVDAVLFIDASDVTTPEKHAHTWLTTGKSDEAATALIPIVDLLANDSILNPRRWTTPHTEAHPETVVARYHGTHRTLHAALETLNETTTPQLDELTTVPRITTIKELAEHGIIAIELGKRAPTSQSNIVTARDIREGLPAQSGRSAGKDCTQAGDILVTTTLPINAVIDHHGGRTVGPNVYRIRVNDTRQCNPEYLAACLTGSWNTRFATGGAAQRISIRDLEIPLVMIDEQHRVAATVRQTQQLAQKAAAVAQAASDVSSAILDMARYGAS